MNMKDYFNETIQVIKNQGKDFGGNMSYGSPVDSAARVKEKYQLVKDKTSKQVTSSIEIKVPADTDISVDDKVIYNSNEYLVIARSPKKDLDGNVVHKKVYC